MPNAQVLGYGSVAKIFHWLIFLLLAAQYAVGSIMPHIGRHTPDDGYVAWHLSIGAAILFVIVLRMLWRMAFPVPLPAAMPRWERLLSSVTHWMLYALILAMTLLGWAAGSSRGWDVRLFGLLPLPPLAAKGAHWGREAGDIQACDTLWKSRGAEFITEPKDKYGETRCYMALLRSRIGIFAAWISNLWGTVRPDGSSE